jgi:hypothetical protein
MPVLLQQRRSARSGKVELDEDASVRQIVKLKHWEWGTIVLYFNFDHPIVLRFRRYSLVIHRWPWGHGPRIG